MKSAYSAGKGLERIWLPSPSLGAAAATWQGIFVDASYSSPAQLNRCNTEHNPTPDSCSYAHAAPDIDSFVGDLIARLDTIRGEDVLINMGDDFAWPIAGLYWPYTDGLIDALNTHPSGRFNASYSTAERYMVAKLASVPSFPLLTGDMFPYADDSAGHNLWAGYFSSRPAFKGLVRESSALQQGARQLQAAAGGAADTSLANPLTPLERALGVAQHHDAISGTAKQYVDQDYIAQLAAGRAGAAAVVNASLTRLSGYAGGGGYALCQLNNVSHCPALEAGSSPVVLLVHNSLGQAAGSAPVRLTVGLPPGVASYAVSNGSGAPVTAQLLPLSPADSALRELYNASQPSTVGAVAWLCFQGAVPAAGYAAFFLQPAASLSATPHTHLSTLTTAGSGAAGAGAPSITNGRLTLTFDAATGSLASYSDAATGLAAVPLVQQWLAYTGADGRGFNGSSQASGAYIFRPLGSTPAPIAGGPSGSSLQLLTGPVLSEARSVQGYVAQEVRLWAGAGDVEVGWTVGPVDTSAGGQEVIARYTAGLAPSAAAGSGSGSTWVSDSNCREGQQRRSNWRPQWNYSGSEPVAANYFPTACHIRTQVVLGNGTGNATLTLALALDRAQGSSSQAPQSLEVMVHRRLLHDDGRGVGEALNEPGLDGRGLIVRGRHWLVLAPSAGAAPALYKAAAQRALSLPHTIIGISPLLGGLTPAAWLAAGHAPSASLLAAPLPPNVHLATLQSLGPARLLLRLAHTFDAGEDAVLSGSVTVGLAGLLQGPGVIVSAVDYTLPGSQPLAGLPASTYVTDAGQRLTVPVLPAAPAGAALEVTLAPGDIRTFLCTLAA